MLDTLYPYLRTGMAMNEVTSAYKRVIHVVRAHPLPFHRRHSQQRRVEAIKVPVKGAVIAGDYASPQL